MLQRRLQDAGHETRCVRNVTDVDDDILRKARELGVHYLDLAAEEMARFDAEMGLLNLLPVYSEPRATSAISEILSLIGAALEGGYAYESGGSVYFSVATFPEFGRISGYDRDQMLELAAEHGGHPEDPNKRDPLDFVLWQPSLPDEPAWESRWGPGRPGWHIECSALALRELGETIDIHGGGRDLVFPHHECETAQSESVTGERFVRLWFHVGPGRARRHEDVEVARQPGLRGRPLQGVGPGGGAAGAAGAPLPRGLGLAHRRGHAGGGGPAGAVAQRTRRRRRRRVGRAGGRAGGPRRRPRYARRPARPRRRGHGRAAGRRRGAAPRRRRSDPTGRSRRRWARPAEVVQYPWGTTNGVRTRNNPPAEHERKHDARRHLGWSSRRLDAGAD